jgi:integrase
MRKGEMLGLEWRRVDLKANLVYLGAEHTKAGKRRSVPLNAEARSALLSRAKYCPASPWVFTNRKGERIESIKTSISSACQNAGIEDFTVHDLRHTCAAWLVSAGASLIEVRDLLGHSTIRMTERLHTLRRTMFVMQLLGWKPLSHFRHTAVEMAG